MIIDYKLLKRMDACSSGIGKFVNTFGTLELPDNVSEIVVEGRSCRDAEWFITKFKPKNCIVKIRPCYSYWYTSTYDDKNNVIKYENSNGYWYTNTYNDQNKLIKYENSNGDWKIFTYNENNNLIKVEYSNGDWKT